MLAPFPIPVPVDGPPVPRPHQVDELLPGAEFNISEPGTGPLTALKSGNMPPKQAPGRSPRLSPLCVKQFDSSPRWERHKSHGTAAPR